MGHMPHPAADMDLLYVGNGLVGFERVFSKLVLDRVGSLGPMEL
jgi:hypothetical protein